MDLSVKLISILFLASSTFGLSLHRSDSAGKCLSLKSSLDLENSTIVDVSYHPAATQAPPYGVCGYETANIPVPLCRVQFYTNTSASSVVHSETWLPDEWYGRFLAVGNGGLGGCISYEDLDYGSTLHFATIASNNGHDGRTGLPFLGKPEVINDFAHRAIHVEVILGKQIVEAYYGRPHAKSYYMGCSTGGRQGAQSALRYPADFDGILAGSPAIDFNHMMYWVGMLGKAVGAPLGDASPSFISPALWEVVAAEVISQCDALDGVRNGIIDEPDACDFRPEALMCGGDEEDSSTCLTVPQIDALRKIYSPLYADGELKYPRFDPGAEGSPAIPLTFSGDFPGSTRDWLKYVILNDTDFDLRQFGPEHGALMEAQNPGGIATFDGDFSAFRDRGGKYLTYHGRRDSIIASGNSKRMHNLVSRTLNMRSLDSFYRLFLVPGMDHCSDGPGAWRFGQPEVDGTNAVNASSHNILLALVDWVEGGKAPDTVIGTADDGSTREHCKYPAKSVWDGKHFVCWED